MIYIGKVSEAKIGVVSKDFGILMEIGEHFTFFVEGYKFMPAYKNGMWDGKIKLFSSRDNTLPFGLLGELCRFADSRGYSLDIDKNIKPSIQTTKEEIRSLIKMLPLNNGRGSEIEARDYQKTAVEWACLNQRGILLSPTGSGKSLMIYMLIRFFLENDGEGKAIIVVPTTTLVEQMTKDFADYSEDDDTFDTETMVHKIYSGKEKFNIDSRIVITTWQSAIKLPPAWFNVFHMVIGDEAHTFKAKSLTTIMERLKNAYFRIGTTGTLDGVGVNELVLKGNFGEVFHVTSTKDLMDSDTLAELKIECLVLKYPEEVRKALKGSTYQDEISHIVSYGERNKFIKNLALNLKGNSLVLYNLVEKHGKPLHKMIFDSATGKRKVFFVSGNVGADEREKIRELTEKENDAIIVASLGTFSQGINIRNLHNIIFASPTKSQVKVLQSIGRGLRKSDNNVATSVYDIADDLSWKGKKNYTLNHAINRVNIYQKEQFTFKIHEVPIR